MNSKAIIIGLIHQLIVVGGTAFVKSSLSGMEFRTATDYVTALFKWKTILGLCMIVCGFVIMQYLLRIINLNYAMPLTSGLCMIATLVISYFFLHEAVSWRLIIGMLIIFAGIVVMSWKS